MTQADLNKQDKAIAHALDEKGESDNFIRLSTGVVLLAKQANPNVLIRIMTANQRPNPPLYFDKMMGREMENPLDPDYISRVQAWEMEYSNGMLNALVGLGTELYSVPDGMEGPHPVQKKTRKKDDTELVYPSWIQEYRLLGLPIMPDSESWRYVTWVLFKAAPTSDDTKLLGSKVKALSGVKEADVRDAENFPESDKTGDNGTKG